MRQQELTISAKDGFQLSAVLREPEVPLKCVIQIHSGTGILQSLYSNFAIYLTQNGYVTLTFDYRGIGKKWLLKEHLFRLRL